MFIESMTMGQLLFDSYVMAIGAPRSHVIEMTSAACVAASDMTTTPAMRRANSRPGTVVSFNGNNVHVTC